MTWLNAQFSAPKSISLFKLTETNYLSKIGPAYPQRDSDDPEARFGALITMHLISGWGWQHTFDAWQRPIAWPHWTSSSRTRPWRRSLPSGFRRLMNPARGAHSLLLARF